MLLHRANRTLCVVCCRKWHSDDECEAVQDKNLDDPGAKERFQDLLEAKETLLDPHKRQR